jgi:hypothetical protein
MRLNGVKVKGKGNKLDIRCGEAEGKVTEVHFNSEIKICY